MGLLLFLALAVPGVYFLWKYLTRTHDYFKIRGVPYEKPLPFLGNLGSVIFQQQSQIEWLLNMGIKYREKGYCGVFDMNKPTYLIQDLELIKEICIKKFDNFPNHVNFGTLELDTIMSDALFLMKDQRWKDMRATLSPAFTTSKMRMMWNLVKEVVDESIKFVQENMKDGKYQVDTKDFYSKITVDVISTCAFGLKVDTIRNPDNEVYYHARNAFDFNSPLAQLKFLFASSAPALANFLKLRLVPEPSADFFTKLVKETLEHRKKTGIVRPDVLQLLLQAQEGKLTHEKEDDHEKNVEFSAGKIESTAVSKTTNWTYNEIASQCFLFFIAGNDTTSTLLNFGSYELAMNPDVQDKLYSEIKATELGLNGDEISYDILQRLPYLDAVVSEILRKHPPGFVLDRVCDRDVTVNDSEGNPLTITKATQIWINAISVHYNYKYFPYPERFMPERFLPENRDKIVPGSYMPFGVGPRLCLGSRFALMEAKIVLYQILKQFRIEPCAKTPVPLRYAKDFQLNPMVPLVVEYRKR